MGGDYPGPMLPIPNATGTTPYLPDAFRDAVLAHGLCNDRIYRRDDVIFYAGDPATDLHLVTRGQIKLVMQTPDGNERILAVLGEGDLVGAAILQHATPYQVDAVALTDTTTCPVGRERFLRLTAERPELLIGFARMLMGRLFHAWELLGGSYASVQTRLSRVLLEQAERFGVADEGGWVTLETALKHEDMAAMIASTRVSVSGAANELRALGALEGTRGRYRIHLPSLTTLAER
jgi:CRP-like cAMP-binding protein